MVQRRSTGGPGAARRVCGKGALAACGIQFLLHPRDAAGLLNGVSVTAIAASDACGCRAIIATLQTPVWQYASCFRPDGGCCDCAPYAPHPRAECVECVVRTVRTLFNRQAVALSCDRSRLVGGNRYCTSLKRTDVLVQSAVARLGATCVGCLVYPLVPCPVRTCSLLLAPHYAFQPITVAGHHTIPYHTICIPPQRPHTAPCHTTPRNLARLQAATPCGLPASPPRTTRHPTTGATRHTIPLPALTPSAAPAPAPCLVARVVFRRCTAGRANVLQRGRHWHRGAAVRVHCRGCLCGTSCAAALAVAQGTALQRCRQRQRRQWRGCCCKRRSAV